MYAPDPLQISPLYSIIFCYQLVTDHFWDRGGRDCEKYENYLLNNYFQTPPIIVHTIFLVALPQRDGSICVICP